jgi:hypothetical protein
MADNPINPSAAEAASQDKIANATILGEPSNKYAANGFVGSDTAGGAFIGYRGRRRKPQPTDNRDLANVPPGAVPEKPVPVTDVTSTTLDSGKPTVPDLRVKIRVPTDYLTPLTSGGRNELLDLNGIIFPYTPTINTEWKADYTDLKPTHSNYAVNFYKNSSVADISIQGKFTVQNDQDALVYLATLHLLRSLTKMRWGGKLGDPDSGAPPPICRLDAYGAFQYKNIPVAITSFKNDLTSDVDFYAYNRDGKSPGPFGPAFCPTSSVIAVILRPMYSRLEMQQASVGKYLNDPSQKINGYL